MPLRSPVPITNWRELGHVHFLGIGGVSMSEIARLMAGLGLVVSGSDREDSPALAELSEYGIEVFVGQVPQNIAPSVRTVVVNSAIAVDNPEFVEVQRRGLPVLHRSAALASLMTGRRGIGVTGTHGKTSTSGMVVAAMSSLQPSYAVGAKLGSTGHGAELTSSDWFIVEADESDGSFMQYDLEFAAITNVEADHLDNWGTPDNYLAGFERFVAQSNLHAVVINADDPASQHLIKARADFGQLITFGTDPSSDIRLTQCEAGANKGASAVIEFRGQGGEIKLNFPGIHNLYNAAAAYGLAMLAGIADPVARADLANFRGTARRFQLVADLGGIRIIDDYAHHPTEVAAVINAARQIVGSGRIIVCFQPHLFSRTRDFAHQFGQALSRADEVIIVDIYPARELPIKGVSSEMIVESCKAAGGKHVRYVPELHDAATVLADQAKTGDIIVTVGAGSITVVGRQIAARLEQQITDRR